MSLSRHSSTADWGLNLAALRCCAAAMGLLGGSDDATSTMRPPLAGAAGGLPATVVITLLVIRHGHGGLVLPGRRGRVGPGGQKAGPAVPAGLGRRGGAPSALARHVRRWDGQLVVVGERGRGGDDDGGVARDDVGRAEVALGREDADLGAAITAPRRRRTEVRPGPGGGGGGEADRPRRRDPSRGAGGAKRVQTGGRGWRVRRGRST
nr:unnamed protein product [Digitaria exilis]